MCKYCENKERIGIRDDHFNDNDYYSTSFYADLIIDLNKIKGRVDIYSNGTCGTTTFSMDINYCPFCGRKLGE